MSVFSDVSEFYINFQGKKGIIGYTEMKRPVYYVKVSFSESPVLIAQYAIHAREYITSYLAMMQAEDFRRRGRTGTVYFIPAVNPDGIFIAETQDPLYKANANGVDLNVNFDARWGSGAKNTRIRGAENYIGEFPFSESETRALRDFTLAVKPDITLSYHSKGEEIYWEFFQTGQKRKRDFYIARAVSEATGYPLKSAGISAGGFKDWCIEKLGISALTIEVGKDSLSHPIGKEHAGSIFSKNRNVVGAAITAFSEVKWN